MEKQSLICQKLREKSGTSTQHTGTGYRVTGIAYNNGQIHKVLSHLHAERAKDDAAEDGGGEDAVEDVPLAVDLAGVDLIEELHQDKGVEDYGVVFRGWGMEGCIPAAVHIKDPLPCRIVRDIELIVCYSMWFSPL